VLAESDPLPRSSGQNKLANELPKSQVEHSPIQATNKYDGAVEE